MTRKLVTVGSLAIAAFAITAFTTLDLGAQVKQGKTRPLRTKSLMKGVVGSNCGALKKGLDEGPADDKAWEAVAVNAELLNEAGHILMADGRCPDKTWADAAKVLQECSAEVAKAVAAKDTAKAKAAFGELTKSCGACHKAHKK